MSTSNFRPCACSSNTFFSPCTDTNARSEHTRILIKTYWRLDKELEREREISKQLQSYTAIQCSLQMHLVCSVKGKTQMFCLVTPLISLAFIKPSKNRPLLYHPQVCLSCRTLSTFGCGTPNGDGLQTGKQMLGLLSTEHSKQLITAEQLFSICDSKSCSDFLSSANNQTE